MVDYDANYIIKCIAQQIKESTHQFSYRCITKNTVDMVLKLLNLVLNRKGLGKVFSMKNLWLINIFPTNYHMRHFDLFFDWWHRKRSLAVSINTKQ